MPARHRISGPTATFLIALLLAVLLYAAQARRLWFFGDEWAFLLSERLSAHRPGEFLGILMQPHNEHWSLLPRLWFWLADNAWGLDHYQPYLWATILLHIAVSMLLWVAIRRLGVNPWIAAGAGAVMAFFGPGTENILWGFQVGFLGSAAFGLGGLLLVDHAGPAPARDIFGCLAGLAALLCSGVGVPFVFGMAVVLLIRRGWRPAALVTGPLAVIFTLWYLAYGKAGQASGVPESSWHQWPSYILSQWTGAFEALIQIPMTGGVALALALSGTIAISLIEPMRRKGLAVLYGLLASAALLSLTTAASRAALGVEQARGSRYLYFFAIFFLPVVALGVDAVVRRWRIAAMPIAALFVVSLVGVASGAPLFVDGRLGAVTPQKAAIVGAATDALVMRHGPNEFIPNPQFAPDATLGRLRERAAAGALTSWSADPESVPGIRSAALIGQSDTIDLSKAPPRKVTATASRLTRTAGGCVRVSSLGTNATARVRVTPDQPIAIGRLAGPPPDGSVAFQEDPAIPVPITVDSTAMRKISVRDVGTIGLRLKAPGTTIVICSAR